MNNYNNKENKINRDANGEFDVKREIKIYCNFQSKSKNVIIACGERSLISVFLVQNFFRFFFFISFRLILCSFKSFVCLKISGEKRHTEILLRKNFFVAFLAFVCLFVFFLNCLSLRFGFKNIRTFHGILWYSDKIEKRNTHSLVFVCSVAAFFFFLVNAKMELKFFFKSNLNSHLHCNCNIKKKTSSSLAYGKYVRSHTFECIYAFKRS